jgi:hypothetical protein
MRKTTGATRSVRKRVHWKGAAIQKGLEHVKLKNLYC